MLRPRVAMLEDAVGKAGVGSTKGGVAPLLWERLRCDGDSLASCTSAGAIGVGGGGLYGACALSYLHKAGHCVAAAVWQPCCNVWAAGGTSPPASAGVLADDSGSCRTQE
jgi:hypothetical protein